MFRLFFVCILLSVANSVTWANQLPSSGFMGQFEFDNCYGDQMWVSPENMDMFILDLGTLGHAFQEQDLVMHLFRKPETVAPCKSEKNCLNGFPLALNWTMPKPDSGGDTTLYLNDTHKTPYGSTETTRDENSITTTQKWADKYSSGTKELTIRRHEDGSVDYTMKIHRDGQLPLEQTCQAYPLGHKKELML